MTIPGDWQVLPCISQHTALPWRNRGGQEVKEREDLSILLSPSHCDLLHMSFLPGVTRPGPQHHLNL